jgi:hypothetical protein
MSCNSRLQQAVADCTREFERHNSKDSLNYLAVRTGDVGLPELACARPIVPWKRTTDMKFLQELLFDPVSRDAVYQAFCARVNGSLDQCAFESVGVSVTTLVPIPRNRVKRKLMRVITCGAYAPTWRNLRAQCSLCAGRLC